MTFDKHFNIAYHYSGNIQYFIYSSLFYLVYVALPWLAKFISLFDPDDGSLVRKLGFLTLSIFYQ